MLDTNATIAKYGADLQNALDKLQLTIKGQTDQIAASGLPNQNASSTLDLSAKNAQSAYDTLNAYLKTIAPLTINQSGGPSVTPSTPGSVLNPNQIIGGALTSTGTALGNTASSYNLSDILKALGGSGSGSATTGGAASTNPYPLGQTPVFMPSAKVFG